MTITTSLRFGIGNAKLSKSISTFSLPAGHTCPFAKECLSKSDRLTGRITDGKHCRFRCFAATGEARKPSVRKSRWHNYETIEEAGTIEKMGNIIQRSLPKAFDKFRVHVAGDFFSEKYFLAWLNVALSNPTKTFYGYTKALPFLVKYADYIPGNFRFTASRGGTCDNLIDKHSLRSAEVVFSVEEAIAKGLPIDHDDSYAISATRSFALLLHGTQPGGTPAATAWTKIMRTVGGYNSNGHNRVAEESPFSVYISVKGGKIHIPSKKPIHFKSKELTYA